MRMKTRGNQTSPVEYNRKESIRPGKKGVDGISADIFCRSVLKVFFYKCAWKKFKFTRHKKVNRKNMKN